MQWLINRHNPSTIVSRDKVLSIYPYVLVLNHRSSDKRPFKINIILDLTNEDGYEVWSFESYVTWKEALLSLGLGGLEAEHFQLAKDAGRVQS